jgi:signal transduction histidine kinase
MDLREAILLTYQSGEPAGALRALASAPGAGIAAALWVNADGSPCDAWPQGYALAPQVATEAAGAASARLVPVRATGGEALVLPLGDEGTLVLVGAAGIFGEDAPAWTGLGAAFGAVARRAAELRMAEDERDLLRQRAEESEALHVLGLAANRTLDPDEVLDLVARFTRTLLGAHYVTVSTIESGRIRTVATVGLRGSVGDDPFAGRVAEARKPLQLGGEGERWTVGDFPFHQSEGMETGLGVPLSLFGETFGALVIGYRRPSALAPRDTRLALTLAGHAAVAISNARLHRALADRSRELEGAYEELRWTAQAKERFFASMSHELRTPLNSVLGFQSLLLEEVPGPLPQALRPFLEKAYRATQNLLLLVNDVLDLSKIEAGKMELLMADVSPAEVVEEAVGTMEPQAAAKGLHIEVRRGPASLRVSTDADRVRQILINLLSNAVKFTLRGRIEIAIHAPDGEGRPVGGEWLEVRVSDTGPGIAPESHERIFHEFEQVVGSSSRGGTGLGLPISRKLARLLGGDLTVQSSPGRGATFTLRLPYGDGARTAAEG